MQDTINSPFGVCEPSRKRLVNIFDIDGCILPSIFNNLGDINDPNEIKRNGYSVKLYPNFLQYFFATEDETLYNIFITGRKKYEFRDLTEFQLHSLLKSQTITEPLYYPQYFDYSKKKYYLFKSSAILDLIQHLYQKNTNIIVRVFDDDIGYYEQIIRTITREHSNYRIMLYKITSNEDWVSIEDHLFSIIGDKEVFQYV